MTDNKNMERELRKAIGQKSREFRKMSGMSQRELADKACCTTQFVSNLERGVTGISVSRLMRLCAAMRCTPNDLLLDGGKTRRVLPVAIDGLDEEEISMLLAITEAVIQCKPKGRHRKGNIATEEIALQSIAP